SGPDLRPGAIHVRAPWLPPLPARLRRGRRHRHLGKQRLHPGGGFPLVSRSAGALRVPILLDDIIPKLGARPAEIRPVVPKRHASVAMILEAGAEEPTVLLLERARRHNDPWSGQIALPGGRRDPCDRDEQAVAVRETREEIGVELSAAH